MELQSRYDDILAEGAEVLAISTDDLSGAINAVGRFGLEFPILYTSGDATVPTAYDVFNLHGDGLASASVFIVDVDGNLAYSNIGKRYSHQVSAETVLEALADLS